MYRLIPVIAFLLVSVSVVAQIATPTTIYVCGGEVSFVTKTLILVESYLTGTSAPCGVNTKTGSAPLNTYPLIDIFSLAQTSGSPSPYGTWGTLTNLSSGLRGTLTNSAGTTVQSNCNIGDANSDKNGHVVFVVQDDGTGGLGHCSSTVNSGTYGNAPPQHGFDYDLAVSNTATAAWTTSNTAIIAVMNQAGGGFTDQPEPVTAAGFTGGSAIIGEERMPSQFPGGTNQTEHAIRITQVNFANNPPTAVCTLSPNSCQFQPKRNWPTAADTLLCEHWYKPYDWYIAPWDSSLHVVGQDDQVNYGGSGSCTALGQTFLQAGLVDWTVTVSSTPSISNGIQLLPRPSDALYTVNGNPRGYGEFIKVVTDSNKVAKVWAGHMVMMATSSVLVSDAAIDECANIPSCGQNHNNQVWLWVRADAGLEVDDVITRADLQNPNGVWGPIFLGAGLPAGLAGGGQHMSIDTSQGGTDLVVDMVSGYLQGSRYSIPIVFSPLQFAGSPAFGTKYISGSAVTRGSVR